MTSLNLKYSEYTAKLNRGLLQLLETGHNADVTFAIEGQFIKAHQVILSMFSTYFEELFSCNPCPHPIFFMKDVSYHVMKDILTFIYAGEVQIAQENVPCFVDAANALKINATIFPEAPKRKEFEYSQTENNRRSINQFEENHCAQIEECASEKHFKVLKHGRTQNNQKLHVKEENHEELEVSNNEQNQSNIMHTLNQLEDNDHDVQIIEDESNNLLAKVPQNFADDSKDLLRVLKWEKYEMDDSAIDSTGPQSQFPALTSPLIFLKNKNKHAFPFHTKNAYQTDRKFNKNTHVMVTYVKTTRGNSIIVDGHRYCAVKNQMNAYLCTKQNSRNCKAKVFLTSDGIIYKENHKPECFTTRHSSTKDHILEKVVYRRLVTP